MKTSSILLAFLLFCAIGSSDYANCQSKKSTSSSPSENSETLTGWATWYNRGTNINPVMANRQPLNEYAMTCALRWKPDGKKYRVTTLTEPSMTVVVTHTDYGPANWTGNLIDLTPAAFRRLAQLKKGKIAVRIERIK